MWADDADRADQLRAAVLIRRDDHRTAGETEQAFSAPMKICTPSALCGVEQAEHRFLGFERLEQGAEALEIGERGDVLEQMAWPRTMRCPSPPPARWRARPRPPARSARRAGPSGAQFMVRRSRLVECPADQRAFR